MKPCTSEKTQSLRLYGIDLLRIIAMFYVVMCHAIGHGAVLSSAGEFPQRTCSFFLFSLSLCCVNLFAVISGYVGYTDEEKKHRYSNIIVMWLQVLFYSVGIAVLAELWDSDLVTFQDFKQMFLPVTGKLYWYFTAYFGLFFLIPLINSGIRNASDRMLKGLFCVIILLFSVLGFTGDQFALNNGYSFSWILLLYILGAVLKKTKLGHTIPAFVLIMGILILSAFSAYLLSNWFEMDILSLHISTENVDSFLFPTHVANAVLHVLLFSKFRFRTTMQKIIAFAAKGTFAVYLLNTHKIVYTLTNDIFASLGRSSILTLLSVILIYSAGFVCISILIDYLRQKLFALFHVQKIADSAVALVEKRYSHKQ